MTEQEIEKHKLVIGAMDRTEMARLYRFAPSDHPYFNSELPLWEVFKKRFFDDLGGFSPTISKQIGWGRLGWNT